jgi:hypothetical protein
MKKLFFFLFLISCASPNLDSNAQYETLIFDDNLTFDEFNNLLIIYAEQNTYPNIDK